MTVNKDEMDGWVQGLVGIIGNNVKCSTEIPVNLVAIQSYLLFHIEKPQCNQ